MLAVVGRGRSAFAIQVRSSSTRCLLKKAYKYNNNRPLPLPPPRFDSVCVAYTQKENVRGTAKPTQSCLQCVKERERERWGETAASGYSTSTSCMRHLWGRRRHLTREGVPGGFPSFCDFKNRGVELRRISYKWWSDGLAGQFDRFSVFFLQHTRPTTLLIPSSNPPNICGRSLEGDGCFPAVAAAASWICDRIKP